MSIENLLTSLIAAVEANTAALTGKAATAKKAPAAEEGEEETPAKKAPAKKPAAKAVTKEDVLPKLTEVKERFGSDAAKALVKKHGGAEKLADVEDGKFAAILKAANDKLAEDDADTGGDDDL